MFLTDHLVLASLAVLILLVLAVLALVVRAASRPEPGRSGTRAPTRLRSDTLRTSFRRAVGLIEAHIAPRAQRYSLPWVLVLDEGDRHGGLPMAQSGIASALGTDATGTAAAQGLAWNFFDKGVVIDVQGAYLGGAEDGDDAAEKPWDQFLSLCRDYRPERPFDALVITVPAALLLDDQPDTRRELARLARRANRRVWLAQNRFAMRFALYIVVAGCERLPGFSGYARALPDLLRKGMLGWSSPHDLSTHYRADWVEEAVRQTQRTLADSTAELLAQGDTALDADPGAAFLLPTQLDALRPPLQLFTDEVMRPSADQDPFVLRGLYFTGDASIVAERLAQSPVRHALAATDPDGFAPTVPAALLAQWESGALPPPATLDGADLLGSVPPEARQPAFLRDLFEQKIFREFGLTRPSGTQHLQRPLLARGVRWAAIGVAGAWCIGLVVGSVVLHRKSEVLQQALTQVHRDNDLQLRAGLRGEAMPPEWQRARTLALLQLMEQMDQRRLWSIFMPGSWPVVDPLPAQVRERLTHTFGDVAATTLRTALQERVSRLTGVAQDASTGDLVSGAPCSDPVLTAEPVATAAAAPATLGFEDLPEFQRLLAYLAAVEQADLATQALQRLQDPAQPARGEDLAVLVRAVLGADLPGSPDHAAELFRARAVLGASVPVAALRQATQCSLRRVNTAMLERALTDNDLLGRQRELANRYSEVTASEGFEAPEDAVGAWRALLDGIREQDMLLGHGDGAWMRNATLQPGAAWERALARIGASPLLGPEAAGAVREEARSAYSRFSIEWAELSGPERATSVVWNEKTARWEASPALVALRDGLVALLGQPWMAPGTERTLGTGGEALVSWDLARLDQALAVADIRKRFQAELLPRFPADLRPVIEPLANAQLTLLVTDHLAAALVPGSRMGAEGHAPEAERNRLIRVQALLTEMGARRTADSLRSLQARDALSRLRSIDDALERADLYTPQGRNFGSWRGEKGPALAAFGLGDGAALGGYLAQQRQRVESLGREAEQLLSQVGYAGSQSVQAERWQAINRDLERYRLKNPNSSLLALENFLTAAAGDVDLGNCSERLAGRSTAATSAGWAISRGSDYFALRQQQLQASLAQRCGELTGRDQQEQWAQFATLFNQTAAGRPPFRGTGWSADATALDLDDVAALLPAFERAQRSLRDLPLENRPPGAAAVRRFIDQFDRVRTFLQPLMPVGEAAAGYDLAVEFRANAQAELEGNKIIDWALEVGPQRLGWRDPPRPLRWEPGMPVALHLRLAKDGPVAPRADERQPALAVEGRSVTLRYADAWALLNLLQRHREGGDGRSEGRSQLLRIEFPLITAGGVGAASAPTNAGDTPDAARARVYLRLTLSPAGKRTPLVWPGAFPARAPDVMAIGR